MEKDAHRTPLHGRHVAAGAMMAQFAGYDMPLWYASVKSEHLSVLTAAGLFDTSHMAAIMLKGPGAFDLLQECFTNDLSACGGAAKKPLADGRCVYGAFLDDRGHVIDDAIVFKFRDEHFMVVVNAGMGAALSAHLTRCLGDREAAVTDLSGKLGKLDLQGPAAARILKPLLADPDAVFDRLPYFSFKGHFDPRQPAADAVRLIDGTPILLSRTGYTGEFGFEIFVPPADLESLWDTLLEAGSPHGLTPCGLAARDSLRAGAVLPLSHQDIGSWPFIRHPWEFALPFNAARTGFTKAFLGDAALLNDARDHFTYPFLGSHLRKVTASDPAAVLDAQGTDIGRVLTCVTDMGIGLDGADLFSIASPQKPETFVPKGLCCGFVLVDRPLAVGTPLVLKDRRRTIDVAVVRDIRPDRTARRPLREML